MRTQVQQTSLSTFFSEIKPTLGFRQNEVLETIREHGPCTNNMISKYMDGRPINCVTPRVFELRKKGKVVEVYRNIDYTSRRAIYWGTPQQRQEYLSDNSY